MEEEEDVPLFWLQTTDTRRLRRQASSIFLNYGVFLIVLLVVAFTFVFVIVPSIGSFTSQVLRPHSIKKSWDSLNLVLVLFAIVCGFLSRNNNSNGSSSSNESTSYYEDQSLLNVQKSHPSTPSHRWFEYQDQTRVSYNTLNRLRSSSSYPDLRQESLERWRFYDDTHLNNYRFSTSDDQIHYHPQQQQEEETKKEQEEDVATKDIDVVDTFVINQKEVSYPSSPPPSIPPQPSPSPPPQPSPPPPKLVRRKVKRTYQDLGYEKRTDHEEKMFDNLYIPPPSQLPPPPPPPPPPMLSKNEKRRGKDFLISLRRKKKKQRQKSVEKLDTLFNTDQPSTSISTLSSIPPPSPPPPTPPPLPPHFFQNLFSSKKAKTKKLHPVPPPPPPPPVTRVSKEVSQKVTSRTKVQVAPVPSHEHPKPVKTSSFHGMEENVESGNASPLISIPPQPPLPPPFKMTEWKFVLDGDYVRVGSFNSSRSGSPDLESVEDATSEKDQSSPMTEGGRDSAAKPLFCPSPDVNTKADNFIARFRAGLKLEKVNSVKGRSNLGWRDDISNEMGD